MQKPNNNPAQTNTAMGDALQRANEQAAKQQQQQQAQVQPQMQQQQPAQPQMQPQYGQQPQFQQPVFTQQQAQQQVPQPDRTSRVFGMNARRPRTFSAQTYSENFKAAIDAVMEYTKAFEQEGFGKNLFLFPVTGSNLAASGMVLVNTFNANGSTIAMAYTMLIENTAAALRPLRGNDPYTGEFFELPRLVGSQYDDLYWNAVRDVVIKNLGSVVPEDSGATVVKSEMDWSDKSRIAALLNNAENANMARMNAYSQYQLEAPLNLAVDINNNVDRINIGFDFNPQPLVSPDEQPYRNNIEVKLSATTEGDVQVQGSEPIAIMSGFMELIYDTTRGASVGSMPMMQYGYYPQKPQCFFPQLVITNTDSGVSEAKGLEFALLSIYAGTVMLENNGWMQGFSPRTIKGTDIADIGAVNYELKLGVDPADPNARPQRIATKDHTFGQQQLVQLLSMACHPEVTVAMDIEETGYKTWMNAAFLMAGVQSGKGRNDLSEFGRGAYDAIVTAANNLTNGHFSHHFTDPNAPITIRDGSRIPGGYYTDDAGVRMDARNIDLLAVMNLVGETDQRTVDEWKIITSSTSGYSPVKRAVMRIAMLQRLLGSNFVLKNFHERVVFSPMFLDALRKSIAAAGLVIRPENITGQYNPCSYGTPMAVQYGINTAQMGNSMSPMIMNSTNNGGYVQQGFRTGAYGNYYGN